MSESLDARIETAPTGTSLAVPASSRPTVLLRIDACAFERITLVDSDAAAAGRDAGAAAGNRDGDRDGERADDDRLVVGRLDEDGAAVRLHAGDRVQVRLDVVVDRVVRQREADRDREAALRGEVRGHGAGERIRGDVRGVGSRDGQAAVVVSRLVAPSMYA